MDHNISLAAGLARLTQSLDKPEPDLERELRRLSDELSSAVESYLGLSITITGEAGPVTVSAWHHAARRAAVGCSLLIPLPLICATPPGSALILHAARPGAFVDLATDLSFAVGEPLPTFVPDQHLTEHSDRGCTPELIGLAEPPRSTRPSACCSPAAEPASRHWPNCGTEHATSGATCAAPHKPSPTAPNSASAPPILTRRHDELPEHERQCPSAVRTSARLVTGERAGPSAPV